MKPKHGMSTARCPNMLQVLINSCLRNILKIRRQEKIRNKNLWTRAKQDPNTQETAKKKWRWTGQAPNKNSRKRHSRGPGLESTRREKCRATEEGLETLNRGRNEESRDNIRCGQESRWGEGVGEGGGGGGDPEAIGY